MKVTIYTWERDDYRDFLEIHIDGVRVFFVHDGEPEDNTLTRNFNDCHCIGALMQTAFAAGKLGEKFTVERINKNPHEK